MISANKLLRCEIIFDIGHKLHSTICIFRTCVLTAFRFCQYFDYQGNRNMEDVRISIMQ